MSDNHKWLITKWKKRGDCYPKRLLGNILSDTPSLINISIINDDIDFFKLNYKSTYDDEHSLKKALAKACLCGSQKTGEFIINELKIINYNTDWLYWDETFDHWIFCFVSASQNVKWAEEIATIMKNNGEKMPDSIYSYCRTYSVIKKLKIIFRTDDNDDNDDDC
ncbi:MAG: hypothetical protein Terrestrivirus1_206 [Terrestrivirus sp.]|uniref:Uncharacterized protein n=1 Tax=Terrestrivirus sp. TaxID=2487775 RepID=A0A3G4ZKG6_9VIRU|nr:MAG: hypothetical protein Terrestrivirus1_206 [Terrestrivirus sp.]